MTKKYQIIRGGLNMDKEFGCPLDYHYDSCVESPCPYSSIRGCRYEDILEERMLGADKMRALIQNEEIPDNIC